MRIDLMLIAIATTSGFGVETPFFDPDFDSDDKTPILASLLVKF